MNGFLPTWYTDDLMKGKSWDRVGSRFADRYDLLGSEGMGAVYKAKHAFTGAPVALKILHAGRAPQMPANGFFGKLKPRHREGE